MTHLITNLSCDLRAEAFRETREVAPPQGSHSPGNNREKKRDHRGCMTCTGWDQVKLQNRIKNKLEHSILS